MSLRALPPLVLLLASIAAFACTKGADPATRGGVAAGGQSAGPSSSGGGPPSWSNGTGIPGLGGAPGFDATAATGGAGGGGGPGGAPSGTSSVSGLGGGGACALGRVVIGEVRSRGAGGATDEFVALFNATGSAVTLDASWTLEVRGTTDTEYRAHWTGAGASVPAWGHFLIAGAGYAQQPAADQALGIGIGDAASLRLVHGGTTVSAVCYAFNGATQAAFDATFTCAGTPASNLPHDDIASAASDADVSLARRPGGAAGNCTDTGDSAADFVAQSPATPAATTSPPTP
jgi:hypothetical protein